MPRDFDAPLQSCANVLTISDSLPAHHRPSTLLADSCDDTGTLLPPTTLCCPLALPAAARPIPPPSSTSLPGRSSRSAEYGILVPLRPSRPLEPPPCPPPAIPGTSPPPLHRSRLPVPAFCLPLPLPSPLLPLCVRQLPPCPYPLPPPYARSTAPRTLLRTRSLSTSLAPRIRTAHTPSLSLTPHALKSAAHGRRFSLEHN